MNLMMTKTTGCSIDEKAGYELAHIVGEGRITPPSSDVHNHVNGSVNAACIPRTIRASPPYQVLLQSSSRTTYNTI